MLPALLLTLLLPQQPEAQAPITAKLTEPPAGTKSLRWSPKGSQVPLTLKDGVLTGSFALGHEGAPVVGVELAKSRGAEHYDVLRIDLDRDGRFGDGEQQQCTPKLNRDKWWSNFEGVVKVPLADGKGARNYPMDLWFVEDTFDPNVPPVIRWTRRGFLEGEFELGGKPAYVVMTEFNMDGVFDQRDSWGLGRTLEDARSKCRSSLERYVWLDAVAYRPTAIDGDGLDLTFEAFDPGVTQAEEEARANQPSPDELAKRAAEPLHFGKDLEAALATAKKEHKRVFVDFQTTWCGPCAGMKRLVYTAQDVVDAAKGLVCVELDGDEQRELVKRYEVKGYPNMLLLDEDGKVLAREVGYRTVVQMVQFLGQQL